MTNISLNQAAWDIMEFYRNTLKDNDFTDIRQIKWWIQNVRAKLIKQKLDKPLSVPDENLVQSLTTNSSGTPLIELELVDSSIYTTIPSGRYVVRTKVALPASIERDNQIGTFTRIGPIDRLGEKYKLVSQETAIISGSGKFNQQTVFAFLLGDRIYLISKNSMALIGLKYLDVRGVFQNPREAALFTNPSYTDDDNYPINANMIDDMKKILLSQEFKVSARNPIDPIIPEEDVVQKRTP